MRSPTARSPPPSARLVRLHLSLQPLTCLLPPSCDSSRPCITSTFWNGLFYLTCYHPCAAAKALDIPVSKVVQVVRVSREAKSLDMPIDQSGSPGAADSPTLVDTLESDPNELHDDPAQR